MDILKHSWPFITLYCLRICVHMIGYLDLLLVIFWLIKLYIKINMLIMTNNLYVSTSMYHVSWYTIFQGTIVLHTGNTFLVDKNGWTKLGITPVVIIEKEMIYFSIWNIWYIWCYYVETRDKLGLLQKYDEKTSKVSKLNEKVRKYVY